MEQEGSEKGSESPPLSQPSDKSDRQEELDEIWNNVKSCFLGCTACMLFVIMIATCTIGFWMLISATLKEHTQDLVVVMETTPVPNKTTKAT